MKPLFLFLFILAALIFRPVPIVPENECLSQTGIVTSVFEGGTNDVNIRLEDNDHMFYINRGLKNGLEMSQVKSDLIGYEVTLKYPKHWTPLDPFSKTHHVSVVKKGDQIIFTELE